MNFQQTRSYHWREENDPFLSRKGSKTRKTKRDGGKAGSQIFHDRMKFSGVILIKYSQAHVGRRTKGGENGRNIFLFYKLPQFLDSHVGFSIEKKFNGKRHGSPFNGMKIKKPPSKFRERGFTLPTNNVFKEP